MFDIGWTELLLIGIVALIVVGPKDLPRMFRSLGQFTARMRGMAREFQRAMDSAADESGVREMGRDLRNMASGKGLGLDDIERSIGGDLTKPARSGTARSTAAKPAGGASTAAPAAATAEKPGPATGETAKPATATPKPAAASTDTAKPAAAKRAPAASAASKTPAKTAPTKAAAGKPAAKAPTRGAGAPGKPTAARTRARPAAAAGDAPKGTE